MQTIIGKVIGILESFDSEKWQPYRDGPYIKYETETENFSVFLQAYLDMEKRVYRYKLDVFRRKDMEKLFSSEKYVNLGDRIERLFNTIDLKFRKEKDKNEIAERSLNQLLQELNY